MAMRRTYRRTMIMAAESAELWERSGPRQRAADAEFFQPRPPARRVLLA